MNYFQMFRIPSRLIDDVVADLICSGVAFRAGPGIGTDWVIHVQPEYSYILEEWLKHEASERNTVLDR